MTKEKAIVVGAAAVIMGAAIVLLQHSFSERTEMEQLRDRAIQARSHQKESATNEAAPSGDAKGSSSEHSSNQIPSQPVSERAPGPDVRSLEPGAQVARRSLVASYPGVETEAGLSADDIEVLANLLGRAAGVSEYVTELGGAKYIEWRVYQESVDINKALTMLDSELAKSGDRFRDDQITSLRLLMSAERRRQAEQLVSTSFSTSDSRSLIEFERQKLRGELESNERVAEVAKTYLSKPQLDALQRFLNQRTQIIRDAFERQVARIDGRQGR